MKDETNKHLLDFISDQSTFNCAKFAYNQFQKFPNLFELHSIDGILMAKALQKENAENVLEVFKESYFNRRDLNGEMTDYIVVFKSNEIIRANTSGLYYYYTEEKILSETKLLKESKKYLPKDDDTPRLRLFVRTASGIETESFKLNKINIDLEKNYNEDFIPVYTKLLSCLESKNNRGLHFLYGIPGTGKTNILRFIISKLKRDVIFIPSGMTDVLSDPTILKVLTDFKGSILIIEDAEKAIVSRESSMDNAVSTLLNISDGLLSDILNMQIICTFNTDISKLDKALLRPGRLLSKYEFKELSTEKAQKLANELGLNKIISKPITLAELYNDSETEIISLQTRKVVGF